MCSHNVSERETTPRPLFVPWCEMASTNPATKTAIVYGTLTMNREMSHSRLTPVANATIMYMIASCLFMSPRAVQGSTTREISFFFFF